MKLEEAKTMQYVFQSNLNERSRGRTKSEEQKMALQNIQLFYEWQETVSKIALTKVKANNTSGNLLNEMRQITYSLYWSKEIIKNVYNLLIPPSCILFFCSIWAIFQEAGRGHPFKDQNQNLTYSIAFSQFLGNLMQKKVGSSPFQF